MAAPSAGAPRPYRSLDDVPLAELLPLGRALARLLYAAWLERTQEPLPVGTGGGSDSRPSADHRLTSRREPL